MDARLSRRKLVAAAVAGSLGAALGRPALAQYGSTRLERQPLGAGLTLISGAGANVLVAETAEGPVLVDGGLAAMSDALLAAATAPSGAPVAALLNTNWRLEHTGSNDALGAAGTKIIAHENTRLWMGIDFFVEWENETYPPRAPQALPNDTFYTSGHLSLGNRRIEYAHLAQAHTDGDIYVFFPDENVLVASDLLCVGRFPVVDYVTGGWIGGLLDATDALLDVCDAETRIVPAQGDVQSRAALETQREFCAAMKDTVGGLIKNGKSLEEVIEARPTAEFDARMQGDPELFLALTYKGIWGHIRELGGVL